MRPNLEEWIWRDYRIPRSNGAQYITVLVLSILILMITLAELVFDLAATNIELMGSICLFNLFLLIYSYKKRYRNWIGILQVLTLYLLFELHVILLPSSFHVINYWMPFVPIIALMLSGLRYAHVWLLVILITLICNAYYGVEVVGEMYNAEIFYKRYLIGASIFTLTIVSCFSIMYNLLGRAYHKLRITNDEVTGLMSKVQEMNESLETTVANRTEAVEEQNRKLKEYAFMNSHLVRAPLANILGAVQHLDQAESDKEVNQMNSIIKKSASDLDQVIREVGEKM